MNQNVANNVKTILSRKGITLTEAGEKLFPTNKYAYAAIKRALDGDCELKADQLRTLSELTGISLEELCSAE